VDSTRHADWTQSHRIPAQGKEAWTEGMRRVVLAVVLLALSCTGCGYIEERGRDFVDIFDVKITYGSVGGLGAKVQITDYFAPGLGVGFYENSWEKYGRVQVTDDASFFLHAVVFGAEMPLSTTLKGGESFIFFLAPLWKEETFEPPPAHWSNRLRVGGEIVLPFVSFGFFINLGQFADFLLGFFGVDLIED
jgi:hypothetical protein